MSQGGQRMSGSGARAFVRVGVPVAWSSFDCWRVVLCTEHSELKLERVRSTVIPAECAACRRELRLVLQGSTTRLAPMCRGELLAARRARLRLRPVLKPSIGASKETATAVKPRGGRRLARLQTGCCTAKLFAWLRLPVRPCSLA